MPWPRYRVARERGGVEVQGQPTKLVVEQVYDGNLKNQPRRPRSFVCPAISHQSVAGKEGAL
jgi:hypothetical protein